MVYSLIYLHFLGFRYELYCMTKAARTTQCTLFSCIPQDQAWTFNTQRSEPDTLAEPVEGDGQKVPNNSNVPYTREIFDALCMRYEEPHSNSRWDSPLVVALPEDSVDWEGIYKSLFETQPLPPNQSTQNVQQTQFQFSGSVSKLDLSFSSCSHLWVPRIISSSWTS